MSETPNLPTKINYARKIELICFLLDGSESMAEKLMLDGREKAEHLLELLKGVLNTLHERETRERVHSWMVCLIYFGETVNVQKNDLGKGKEDPFFWVEEALKNIKASTTMVPGKQTALAHSITEAGSVIQQFFKREDMPFIKSHSTMFLFTDGVENTGGNVMAARQKLEELVGADKFSLATISFGSDADNKLLMEIASEITKDQRNSLINNNLLDKMENPNKLFLVGDVGGGLTQEKASIIRRFVYTLTVIKS
jgi:uncharacterized protein YegL